MKAIVVAIFLVFPTCAFAHDGVQSKAPVAPADAALAPAAKAVDAFHDALAKGDRAAVEALLADDVHIYEQGWVERSKAEYASHHLASDIAFSKATRRKQTARSGVVLGDLAYVTREETVSGEFEGKAINSVTLETMVLRRAKNNWRIVHIHWSSRAAKQ